MTMTMTILTIDLFPFAVLVVIVSIPYLLAIRREMFQNLVDK